MGLMSKLKDLFIDVEDVEVEEEEEQVIEKAPAKVSKKEKKVEEVILPQREFINDKENKEEEVKFRLPKVMMESIENEKREEEEALKLNENIKPKNNDDDYREMVPRNRSVNHNYNFDIDFEKMSSNQNVLAMEKEQIIKEKEKPKKVAELYADPKKESIKAKKEEKKIFAPSPVISPVYGILDKNYKTDELLSKSESSYEMQRHSKKIDFESVRRKAFGNLTDDIKNNLCEDCELFKEVKRLEKLNEEELLYDMTVDSNEAIQKDEHPVPAITGDNTTLEDAYDNYSDFGVVYESRNNMNNVINTSDYNESVRIVNHTDSDSEPEKIVIKDVQDNDSINDVYRNKNAVNEDTKLTDDLFDLIDSMYKEGDEQ